MGMGKRSIGSRGIPQSYLLKYLLLFYFLYYITKVRAFSFSVAEQGTPLSTHQGRDGRGLRQFILTQWHLYPKIDSGSVRDNSLPSTSRSDILAGFKFVCT